MLLLITVMCIITKKKKQQLNIARLCCHNFYHWWFFNWGAGPLGPPGFVYVRGAALTLRHNANFSCGAVHQQQRAAAYAALLPSLPSIAFFFLTDLNMAL